MNKNKDYLIRLVLKINEKKKTTTFFFKTNDTTLSKHSLSCCRRHRASPLLTTPPHPSWGRGDLGGAKLGSLELEVTVDECDGGRSVEVGQRCVTWERQSIVIHFFCCDFQNKNKIIRFTLQYAMGETT